MVDGLAATWQDGVAPRVQTFCKGVLGGSAPRNTIAAKHIHVITFGRASSWVWLDHGFINQLIENHFMLNPLLLQIRFKLHPHYQHRSVSKTVPHFVVWQIQFRLPKVVLIHTLH